ncbi:hypothetical protein MJL79_31775, partial [Salmonella enterica subsp. enterica serovar Montevideo]|nr:hypothetical protein [Salmonella enterica subsp. enterica serovar Montevideo]
MVTVNRECHICSEGHHSVMALMREDKSTEVLCWLLQALTPVVSNFSVATCPTFIINYISLYSKLS